MLSGLAKFQSGQLSQTLAKVKYLLLFYNDRFYDFYAMNWRNEIFLSCWILTQIAKWTNMLNWDRQINLPATLWWFLDVSVVAEKFRQKGPIEQIGKKGLVKFNWKKITQNFNNTELQIITQLYNFDLYCTQIIFQLNFAFLILWNLQFKLEKSSFASVFNSYDASP